MGGWWVQGPVTSPRLSRPQSQRQALLTSHMLLRNIWNPVPRPYGAASPSEASALPVLRSGLCSSLLGPCPQAAPSWVRSRHPAPAEQGSYWVSEEAHLPGQISTPPAPKAGSWPSRLRFARPSVQKPPSWSPISLPPTQSGLAIPLDGGLQLQAVNSLPTSLWPRDWGRETGE